MGIATRGTHGGGKRLTPTPPNLADRRRVLLGLGAAGLAGCSGAEGGRPVSRLLLGGAAGGNSDAFVRLFVIHLQRLTGRTIIVENEPRAGGMLAAERLSRAAPDGRTVGFVPPALIHLTLLGQMKASAPLTDFGWLAGVGADRRVLAVNRQGAVADFQALLRRTRPLIMASSTTTSPNYVEAMIVRHLTGAPMRPVPGYDGGARNLAFASGEVQGIVAGMDAMGGLLQAPGARLVLRLNDREIAGHVDLPTLATFARGQDAPPLMELIEVCASLGRMFALPPGAPAAVLDGWRSDCLRVIADPGFRTAAAAQDFTLETVAGAVIQQTLARILDPRAATAAALARALDTRSV
jgi:tripartite-type tricarboxylate transporter receptor subunit TctC